MEHSATLNLLKGIFFPWYEYKYKSSKEFLKFDDAEIKKKVLYCSKSPINVGNVNICKILISEECLFVKKVF